MHLLRTLTLCMMALLMLTAVAVAEDKADTGSQDSMPPMGPPPEITELAHMVGTWDVAMQSKWNPEDTAWTQTAGVCTYEYVAAGAALAMTFTADMMGMPFEGYQLLCFDRMTGKWQSTWTDNMAARITWYEGDPMKDGKLVLIGDELMEGKTMPTRITTYNITEDSFDWMMETSFDGGKTFFLGSKAKYTKRNR